MPVMPGVEWHPSPNRSPGAIGWQRGIVFHHIVGSIENAESRFLSPSGGASAHWGVGYDGRIVQWVDTNDASWHACSANRTGWLSIEHQSPSSGDLWVGLTDEQIAADARILRWCNETHGTPMRVAASWQDTGLSYHSANPGPCSTNWGQTGCPGDAIIADRQRVVDLALGGDTPHPPFVRKARPMLVVWLLDSNWVDVWYGRAQLDSFLNDGPANQYGVGPKMQGYLDQGGGLMIFGAPGGHPVTDYTGAPNGVRAQLTKV